VVAQSIIETVRAYAQRVWARYPVKRVLLYGSFARGTGRPDSDIDVAVVLEREPADILQTEADLCRIGMDVDVRMEPIVVDEQHDPSGFYDEISRHGTLVYSAPQE
jgi:predicted nucleotidyltransferase